MDESYLLEFRGSLVDYLAARYVIGARVKAAQGIMRVWLLSTRRRYCRPAGAAAPGCPESATSGLGIALPAAVAAGPAGTPHHPATMESPP